MYDFTWRSLFWTFGVFCIPVLVFVPFGRDMVIGFGGAISGAFLCYVAVAPILAFIRNSYRESRSVQTTLKRLAGLFVAMVLVAILIVVIGESGNWIKVWLADKPWGWIITGIVGVLTLFGYALNLYDAYRVRKQINSLHTYTPSDSRKVVAKR